MRRKKNFSPFLQIRIFLVQRAEWKETVALASHATKRPEKTKEVITKCYEHTRFLNEAYDITSKLLQHFQLLLRIVKISEVLAQVRLTVKTSMLRRGFPFRRPPESVPGQ